MKQRVKRANNIVLLEYPVSALGGSRSDTGKQHLVVNAPYDREEQFSGAFEHAAIGMALVALDGHWLKVNHALCELVGYSEQELVSTTFQEVTHPDDRESHVPLARQLLAGEIRAFQIEKRYLHRTGRAISIQLSISLVRDQQGKPLHFISQIQDITARKQAEEALKLRADEFAALYDTTRDLGAEQELPVLLKTIVMRATMLLHAASGFVYLFDRQRGDLELVIEEGFSTRIGTRLAFGEGMAGRVAQTRQPMIVDDYRTWEHHSPQYEGSLVSAVVQVPMLSGGEMIGVLGIQEIGTTERRFNEGDVRILSLFAGQAASAVHSARLLAETQRRADELVALHDTTLDLSTQYDLSTLLKTIVERATTLLAAPAAFVYLYDPAQHNLELKIIKGVSVPLGTRLELGEGMAGRVAQSYHPLIIDDYMTWEHRATKYNGIPFSAVLEVPMHYGGELIGVLAANEVGPTERKFTEADARLLSLFAVQAASAVHNARLFEEANRRSERLAVLNRIARSLGATLRLDELLEIVFREITTVLHTEAFYVALYNESTQELNFRIRSDREGREPPEQRPLGKGMTELVVKSKKPLLIRDLEREKELLPLIKLWGTGEAPRSCLIVPIMLGDQVVGVVSVQTYRPNAYDLAEEELLSTIADTVAVAIENARLYESEERRSTRLTEITRLGTELATLSDETSMLEVLATRTAAIEASPTCAVMLVNELTNEAVCVAQTGFPEETPLGFHVPLNLPIIRRSIETGQPVIAPNIDLDAPEIRAILVRKDLRAFFAYPMRREGRTLGFITLSALLPHSPSQEKIAVYQLLAERAAAALENVRLLEETRQRLAEMEAVNRISIALRAAQSLDEMLPILLGGVLSAVGGQAGAIWLRDPEKEILQSAMTRGWFGKVSSPISSITGIGGNIISTGQTYNSVEFKSDPNTSDLVRAEIPAGWGGAMAPIRATQEIIGIFAVSVELPRVLTENETRLLTTVAEIAGNAIQRTRFHEQTEQQLARLHALHTIDKTITSSLDQSLTLGVILTQVTSQLQVDAASILLLNPLNQTLEFAAGRGFRTRAIERSSLRLGEGYAGRVALERRSLSIAGLPQHQDDFVRSPLIAGEGFVTYAGVPLIAKSQVKGVLEVFHRSALPSLPNWQEFFETLAEQAAIAIDSIGLFNDLQRSNMELSLAYDTTLEGWSHALDLRDRETEGHTQRAVELSLRLAREMGIGERDLVHIRRGALLHDIGKMGVADNILLKPGPLTPEEEEIMRKHPQYALDMLAPIQYLARALDIPYSHHEKWDGTGYPRGLKGEQIPLAARIFAVVDVWDALLSDRPYRPAWSEDRVREHIRAQTGLHFDPRVSQTFFKVIDR